MRSFTRRSKMQLDKLPAAVDPRRTDEINYSARESWRMLGIMAKFVESTERLASIRPAVSIFGRARTPADHAYYMLTPPPSGLRMYHSLVRAGADLSRGLYAG